MSEERRKYRIESYPSGTKWLISETGTKLHCGYWTSALFRLDITMRQRNLHERSRFIHNLCDALNEITSGKPYKPYVWLITIIYMRSETGLYFVDPFFGNLSLCQYNTSGGSWTPEAVPKDFYEDLEALMNRVVECDKED